MYEDDRLNVQKHSHPLTKNKELMSSFMGGGAVTLRNGFVVGASIKCNVGNR